MSHDTEPTLFIGRLAWNALELNQDVAAYLAEATEQDGWTPKPLIPPMAFLQENPPWINQWHNVTDTDYN